MPVTMREPVETTPDRTLVTPRPQMAKAALDDKAGQGRLSEVVKEAAKRSHGKEGAAARHLGKDEGNFSRDVKAGRITIGQLEELGSAFLAAFGTELVQQFGPLSDPADHAERLCDQMQAMVNELRQFVRASRVA